LLDDWLLESSLPDRLPGAAVAGLHESAMNRKIERIAPVRAKQWAGWLSWRPLTAAAAIVLLGLVVFAWSRRGVEVEVVQISGAVPEEWVVGEMKRLSHCALVRGGVQMRLSSGVLLDVRAPVEMTLVDNMHVQVLSGRITVDAGENGKGFVVETPETRVVDLGTVFGVDASSVAKTDVVVFKGQVQVFEKGVPERLALLSQGEGLRVERHRRASRIVSVTGEEDSGSWSAQERASARAVITSVSDSMSANEDQVKKFPSLRNFYRIVPGGLGDGALAFADEFDQWTAVPPSLKGADLVRTFSVDALNWWMDLTLRVQTPCEVFVFVDVRLDVPEWLSREFTRTGETILLDRRLRDSPHQSVRRLEYAVWKRSVPQAGEVRLGAPYPNPLEDKEHRQPRRMYGVAAKVLP
jgi:hypothetical protein